MSSNEGSKKNFIGLFLFLIVLLPLLLIVFIFSLFMFFFQNGSFCSSFLGWRFDKCEVAQHKFDVMFEEEIPEMGLAMAKLREGMNSITFENENGELVNPSNMQPFEITVKKGEDDKGKPILETVKEYPGSIFIRSLMTLDDFALEQIKLDDASIEERFGVTPESLLNGSTLGYSNDSNNQILNEGFDSEQDLIVKLKNKVIDVGKTYDFYPSIMMAQIILESASGTSELATKANNLLGIKADSNWKGDIYTKKSPEGSGTMVVSDFKKYPSIDASIEDYGKRTTENSFMKDRYAPVKRSNNASYTESLKKLAPLYATDPSYESKLLDIIQRHKLTDLDNEQPFVITSPSIEESPTNPKPSTTPLAPPTSSEIETKFHTLTETESDTVPSIPSPQILNPLKGKTIVLDPGHGGHDGGATPFAQYPEKQFNLDIGLSMKSRLEALGATVIMTRTEDVYPENYERPQFALKNNADMFISIHANAFDNPKTQGTETLYATQKDIKLATEVQKHMLSAWGLKDRGIKKRSELAVLKGLTSSSIPAILVEPGFMHDPNIFNSHFMNQEMKDRLTLSLIAGVMSYYGLELTDEMKNVLGEIPPSVQGENGGANGVSDSHLSEMGRKHNNFFTAWMMARTLEVEYENYRSNGGSSIDDVFDDIIDARALSLEFNRRDWLMTVQTESYMCFFVGDKTNVFRALLDNLSFRSLERIPCENLNLIYEKTFGERITFIPEAYQAIVAATLDDKRETYICPNNTSPIKNPETGEVGCGDGSSVTPVTTNRKVFKYPEVGDVLGQFGLFTIYLNDLTVPKNDDTYIEYLEERILRDMYNLEYEIQAISMLTSENACVDSNISGGTGQISDAVKSYAEPIKKELNKYGLENMMPVLLGIMQQESGGTLSKDVMQSSQSIGLKRDEITDPQKSIEVGVEHFYKVYTQGQKYGVDLQAIIQSYNMGGGYINHVARNGGKHTEELAKQFSAQQMEKNPGEYVCEEGNFRIPYCYGDFSYTGKVLSFVNNEDASSINTSSGTTENPCSPSLAFESNGNIIGDETFQKMFASADQYKGTRYSYGGTNPRVGIDCSAFMQVIYREALGVNLPRTAAMQYDYTKRISKEQLKPGDLVFFTSNNRKVGHVGMYIGDGKMYHSGTSKGVSIENVFTGYWSSRIVGYGKI